MAGQPIRFSGNPVSPVVPMPRFLRVGTGNPRAVTDGVQGSARWGCDRLPERASNRYPLCPDGSQVTRTFDFPSCWDGLRSDSPNHRDHMRFPGVDGACPPATFPVAQLRVVLSYRLPPGRTFAIDSFPDQHRSPMTDHAFFVDVMPDSLMAAATRCINAGKTC